MTACKDSLSGKKAESATLAGVLAVGMVPAAAFAETAQADTTGEQGIELQEKTPAQAFQSGSFAFVDQAGNAVATTAKKDGSTAAKAIELAYTGENQYLVPSTVTIDGVDEPVDLTSGDYTVAYAKEDGTAIANQYTIKESGAYKVTVTANAGTDYAGATATFHFKIGEAALEGVTLYEVNAKDANDVSDTSFNFTGSAVNIAAAKDGKPLTGATVTFYNAADKSEVKDAKGANVQPTHAGDYIANVKQGTKDVDIPFTINAVDLSKAAVVMGDVTTSGEAPQVTKAGSLGSAGLGLLRVIPEGTQDYSKPGTHNATVQLDTSVEANKAYAKDIIGSAAVTYNVLSDELAATDFKYDNGAWVANLYFATTGATTIGSTNYVKGSFDCDKIAVYKKGTGAASATTENKLAAGTDYTVTVADKDGNVVDAASTKTAGTWTVTVKALYTDEDTGNVYGGTATTTVEVINGQIGSANVTATYKGKVVDGVTASYTGEDVAKDVAITVTAGTGSKKVTLVEGTDYKVTLKQGTKEVSEAVDQGNYTLEVEGITYKGTDTVTIKVDPASVTEVRPAGLTKVGDREFLAGDGSALDPSYEFVSEVKDGKKTYSELPTDAYKIAKIEYKAKSDGTYKEVKAIDKAGFYKVTFSHNNKDVKGNYTIASPVASFEVNEGKYFTDVLPGDWFYNEVYAAKDKSYVHGIGGTKMYAPYDSMTRADVCMVLMRMAGGDPDFLGEGDDASYTDVTYETGFNDVSSSAYYAKAVQWAAKAGIVKGYGDTGSFGPNDAVTREQFATMLSRYAKAAAGDASSLDAYVDAAAVSDYAKGTIAWAVEAGVMGKDTDTLAPQKEVSRAEVAAMAVRLQPNGPVTL